MNGCTTPPDRASGEAPGGLALVRGGRPQAQIVVPTNPVPVVQLAAEELQYHVRRASGAELRIVPASQRPQSGVCVYLGGTEAARAAGVKVPADTPNAFVIKRIGDSLFILGDDSEGVEIKELRDRLVKAALPEEAQKAAAKEIDRLARMPYPPRPNTIFGTGLGLGSPGLVPVAISDFIYAAIAEETGLFGTLGLLAIISLIPARGLRAAIHAPDLFRRLLAAGITTYFGVQTLLIIGGNIRLLPLTGVTLPFVSYGGSSLLTSFIALLILLQISNHLDIDPAPLP